MAKKEISGFGNKSDNTMYPLCFGVSCAFFALQVISKPRFESERWFEIRSIMLQGSARLLGLLVWKVQKQSPDGGDRELKSAKREIENLKSLRREDAKANEKVVSIFATHEQSWLSERKRLHQHIGALMNELRIIQKKTEEAYELNKKLKEVEALVESKDKVLKEEEQKRKELEEKLTEAERNAEELRENAQREIKEHSSELRKQKTVFIGKLLEQKEESELMIQKLSMEVSKLHKDLEQKGRILSAMLKKARLDSAEKQMLIKEAKWSKARRKQAEQETEKWRAVSGGRYKRPPRVSKEPKHFSPLSDHYSLKSYKESVITGNEKHLEDWVKAEAQNYAAMIEQRHQLELEAFAEELSNKAEKIESFQWQLLRMELETKKLQSHVKGLIKDVAQLRHDKMKLETILLERDKEMTSPKEKLELQLKSSNCSKHNLLLPSQSSERAEDAILSELKRKSVEKEQEMKETLMVEYCKKEALSAEMKDSLVLKKSVSEVDSDAAENLASTSNSSNEASHFPGNMDLHAVEVFYKIKRLKQQLVLIDRLIGQQTNGEAKEINDDSNTNMMTYLSLASLLNKQVERYQSLQEKMDNLRKLMHENDLHATKGKTETLELFLEETFQVQRCTVTTGQKLAEIQSRMVSGFAGVTKEMEESSGIDTKRFADSIRNLLQEVQRGLEIRTARIIGDLEGTLPSCEGMVQLRR
ncbi:hypothetical protein QN277_017190 [Acacia crassicarpa]|uniref:Uncharacterized protein n=1 Tax=Acacia crassicarpa TaxID=499986 RepID=A0AAE1MQ75_9FABA|nr:hypothetical protein QN277_017190 [Acacia crassicarpa]